MTWRVRAIPVIAIALGIVQLVMLFVFVRFIRAADLAMDKSGLGDLELWKQYNYSTSDVFLWLFMTWIASLAFAYTLAHPWRKHLFIWFGFVIPLVGAVVYVASLILFPVHSDA